MHHLSHESIVTNDQIVSQIQQRLLAEPAYKAILYKMLFACKEAKTFTTLEKEVLAYPEMRVASQTVQVLLSWLVECCAIQEILQADQVSLWITTNDGRVALEKENEEDKIEKLFLEDSKYQTIYVMVLQFCKEAKSRMEVENHLANHPLLENPKIYASYFIDMLEKAGGLVWNGCWQTTQKAYTKLS